MLVIRISCFPTFELNISVRVVLCSSNISLFVFVFVLKLFSVIVVALGVSAKYIPAVTGMLNRLTEDVRLVPKIGDIVDYNSPACRPWPRRFSLIVPLACGAPCA